MFFPIFSHFGRFFGFWFLRLLSQKIAGQNLQAQVMDLMHRTLTPEDVRGIFCWGASDFEAQKYTPQKINGWNMCLWRFGAQIIFPFFSWVMAVGDPAKLIFQGVNP